MPLAPAAICLVASSGLLWVLICGRLATPTASQAAWMRAILASTRSMSITAQGVPYSRAILAARGVVMLSLSVRPRMGRANGSRECAPDDKLRETHQGFSMLRDGYRFAPPILRFMPALFLRGALRAPAICLRPRPVPS